MVQPKINLGLATVVLTLGNLASFPSYSCLVYYDYAVLLLISLLINYIYIHALINANCAGTRLYR